MITTGNLYCKEVHDKIKESYLTYNPLADLLPYPTLPLIDNYIAYFIKCLSVMKEHNGYAHRGKNYAQQIFNDLLIDEFEILYKFLLQNRENWLEEIESYRHETIMEMHKRIVPHDDSVNLLTKTNI